MDLHKKIVTQYVLPDFELEQILRPTYISTNYNIFIDDTDEFQNLLKLTVIETKLFESKCFA